MHFLGDTYCQVELQEEVFLKLKHLRAIDLSGGKYIRRLPDSIGELRQLHYLCLANAMIEALPNSISRLCNLRTLDCTHCKIQEIPADVRNLVNLEHLVLDGHVSLPNGIGCLTKLQTKIF